MSDLEALERLLASRRSVRRFRPDPPDDATIERLLRAAISAPSASNKQPWRFFVVRSRPAIEAMAAAVRVATDEVARHMPGPSAAPFRAYGDYFTRFEGAPVVIVPAHRGHAVLSHLVDETLPDALRSAIAAMERDSGLVSTALAIENLLLAAHAMGLGASAMTGPLLAVHRLRAILGIPEGWGVAALVPVGYPDEAPSPTDRKPLDKVTRWIL